MDKELTIRIKNLFEKIGKASLPLCRNDNNQIEESCRKINSYALEGFKTLLAEERKISQEESNLDDEGFSRWAEECRLNDSTMNEG
tara:strand:- start:3082 stop:3339 length:258 start_codon:yes stop_codon:yes gene_type:complete